MLLIHYLYPPITTPKFIPSKTGRLRARKKTKTFKRFFKICNLAKKISV